MKTNAILSEHVSLLTRKFRISLYHAVQNKTLAGISTVIEGEQKK